MFKKFIEEYDVSDWEIETDTGWHDISKILKTVKYEKYQLILENGYLECADNHIVFDQNYNEIFVKDLVPGDTILTNNGTSTIISVFNTKEKEHMYDLSVNSEHHRYFTNGILSHNTTCAAIYLTWRAMFYEDQTILIAAHKFAGSQEIMQRVRYLYETCPDFIRAGVKNYNKGSIEFDNNSRIISTTTTGTTGRGMSISLLYLDEFAYVSPTIAEEFWSSIAPTLATGGQSIITSTPTTDEGMFAQIWISAEDRYDEHGHDNVLGTNGFYALRVYWDEHPDRDEEWSKKQIAKLGMVKWRREYLCEFVSFDETLIDPLKLAKLSGKKPLFTMGQVRWYKKVQVNGTYVIGLDPAMGTGGDYSAIQVFEVPSYEQVAEWRHNTTNIPKQVSLLKEIAEYIESENKNSHNIYWSVENNTIGEAALIVINEIGEENIPGLLVSEPIKKGTVRKYRKGFNTTHSSKLATCSRLKTMIESNRIEIHSFPLISELKTFISHAAGYRAKIGFHDDLISATLLIIRMIVILKDWDPRVYNTFRSIETSKEEWEPPMPIYISSYS